MPQRPPVRLTQRRYFDDHEVKRRAPVKGVSWMPPLGPPRKDGPLEPPALDDPADAARLATTTRRPARPHRRSSTLALTPPTWTRPPRRSSTTWASRDV